MTADLLAGLYEAVYNALTTPLLSYTINNADGSYGSTNLAKANVVDRSVWLTGPNPPNPLLCFAIGDKSPPTRTVSDRIFIARIWAVADAEITARFLNEAVRRRLHTADSDFGSVATISRTKSANSLGVAVRECIALDNLPAAFDTATARWYIPSMYRVIAA